MHNQTDTVQDQPQREVMPSNLPPAYRAAAPVDAAKLDAFVQQHRWDKVAEALGQGDAAALSPALRVVRAVALKETEPLGAESPDGALDAQRMAVEAFAELLGMSPTSTLPRVLALRTLRRNWRTAPAPRARTSLLLLAASLALGSLVGYLLGPGRDALRALGQ